MNSYQSLFYTFDQYSTAGGGQVILRHLITSHKEGITNSLLCPEGDLAQQAQKYCSVTTFPLHASLFTKMSLLHQLARSSKELHIHGISALPSGIFGSIATRIKKIYTEHVMTKEYRLENRYRDLLQKITLLFLLRMVDTVECVSRAVHEYMQNSMRISPKKLILKYNPMPIIPITYVNHQERKVYNLATIGALAWIKNVHSLLRITKVVSQQVPIHLHILGGGSLETTLRNEADELGLRSCVSFYGIVPHNETIDLLTDIPVDLYVQSSFSESFGYAIAEAMAAGIPGVAYRVGGIPELICDEQNGRLITPYDEESFAHAIIELLNNTPRRSQLGRSARKTIEQWKN